MMHDVHVLMWMIILMLWYNRAYWDANTVEAAVDVVDPPNVIEIDDDEIEA